MKLQPYPFHIISHTVLRLACGLGFNAIDMKPQSTDPSNISESFISAGELPLGTNIDNNTGANTILAEPVKTVSIPKSLTSTVGDGLVAGIKEFLGKPIIVQSGSFTTSDVATTFSFIDVMYPLLYNSIHYNKLAGVLGVRATAVATLHVNGTKFQQGLYMLCFIPTGGSAHNTTRTTQYLNMHCYTLVQTSQLHRVILDVNCDTEVQLRVPYHSCTNALPITNSPSGTYFGSPGYFLIYPYDALNASTGSLTASYSLYIHYEDIELFGNTVPQSGRFKGNPMSTETSNKPISSGLKLASQAANIFSAIPLLSSVAGPASWFLDAASKVAWSFGFSKPQVVTAPGRVQRELITYMPNTDTPDASTMLAYSCDNQISNLQVAATDLDEMSIDYLKQIPTWFTRFGWLESNAVGTIIYNTVLTPSEFITTYSDTKNTLYCHSPVGALSWMFAYYTGSVTFTFRFTRTQFHSGRLAIIYMPYEDYLTTPTINLASLAYCHHTIIDIRESNIATINFPYVNTVPWRTCGYSADAYGSVSVMVIDPLVAPANVPTSINVNVEGCGGPDLQFAVPSAKMSSLTPVVPFLRQGATVPDDMTFQSGNPCSLAEGSVGTTQFKPKNLEINMHTIGEIVSSVRTILKRPNSLEVRFTGQPLSTSPMGVHFPFALCMPYSSAAATYVGPVMLDHYNQIGSWYAMLRGGLRIKYISETQAYGTNTTFANISDSVNALGVPASPFTFGTTYDAAQFGYYFQGTAQTEYSGAVNHGQITLPHYHSMHSKMALTGSYMGASVPDNTAPYADRCRLASYSYSNGITADGYDYTKIYRSIADDFSFHGFVSVPPAVIWAAPS
jgi:hypothetical protein